LEDFLIAFLIASLRIDEWWISSQNHNLANLFVDIQSTNSISSRGQKTSVFHHPNTGRLAGIGMVPALASWNVWSVFIVL
jgi:hypothetical protein